MGNFIRATFLCCSKTYAYLTPDLWAQRQLTKDPYQEYTDFLSKTADKAAKASQANQAGKF